MRSNLLLALGFLLTSWVFAGATRAQTVDNDDCAAATPITDGTYQGTTVDASTVDPVVCTGNCVCYGSSGTAPDVWYLYTATCSGTLLVDTCGSEPFDTWLSIHEPGCTGAELACNEDDCGPAGAPYQSRVTADVVEGEQYLIRVSGWSGETGPFELHVSCEVPPELEPVADRCAEAVPLQVPSTTTGTTVDAGYDPAGDRSALGLPRETHQWSCGRENWGAAVRSEAPGVWYRVVGTGTRMTARVTDAPGAQHAVLVFCNGCDPPICVAGKYWAQPDATQWCSRTGQPYWIWVSAQRRTQVGIFELSVTAESDPCYGAVDCTPVEVIDTLLTDDGDHDSSADTGETVNLRFTVTNRSSVDVSNLVAHFATDDPRIACMAETAVSIGDLGAGEIRLTDGALTFRVADVNRLNVLDEFSAGFRVSFTSDQFEDLNPRRCSLSGVECVDHADCVMSDFCAQRVCTLSGTPCSNDLTCVPNTGDLCVGRCSYSGLTCIPSAGLGCGNIVDYCVDESQPLSLMLDLDSTGGFGPTTFYESFESGPLGTAFTAMNLDAGLASLEASDGYRCQYNDPATSGSRLLGNCFLGASASHGDAYFWQVDGSRAFTGTRSLYMGVEVEPGDYRTPAASLEAVATGQPVQLAWGVCSGSAEVACSEELDCPSGESCDPVTSELTFKHQISLPDSRLFNTGGHHTLAQGVIQVQIVDAAGHPLTPWRTIEAKENRYDSTSTPHFIECTFDPIDDGSTEDDLFDFYQDDPPVGLVESRYISVGGVYVDHGDGGGSLGPSSLCFPRRVFARAGDTDEPFDPQNLNGPTRGPGLRGELGPGTWVEPRFSLDEYRGRRIRIRFLTSALKLQQGVELIGGAGAHNDGWWIDDVQITHALMEPATVIVDTKEDPTRYDTDLDCVGDTLDCAYDDDQTWSLPGEVPVLRAMHSGGTEGTTTLTWAPAAHLGATAVDYVVITREGSSCAESAPSPGLSITDSTTPAPGVVRRFLVQAENACGRGPLGSDSASNPRSGCQ